MAYNNLAFMFRLVLLSLGLTANNSLNSKKDQTSTGHSDGICKSRLEIYGYECQEHHVTTEDGYILSVQRIPNGRSGTRKDTTRKVPVLLQHGVLMDGITWLLSSPDESLGYILADSGYDVWIANSRGTKYSLQHMFLSPNSSAYWEWSWDQLVAYDLPAVVEYVYNQTRNQKIHYIGHSLGTLMLLASFCEHRLLDMIRSAALLCPIAFLDQITSSIARASANAFVSEVSYWLGFYEFNIVGRSGYKLLLQVCSEPGVNCYDLITSFTGQNCCLNSSSVRVFLDHEPQSTAMKNMIHMAQMIRRGTIARYDYDDYKENMKHYGRVRPPAYNMSNIPNDFPLFLSYGGRDALSDSNDVRHLLKKLRRHHKTELEVRFLRDYAHGDFVMAVNAKQLVYDPLISFLRLY